MASTEDTLRLADKVCKAFNAFDEDGNGNITVSELEAVLCQLDAVKWNGETCQRLLQQLDRNKDGTINFTEFVNYVCDDRKPKAETALLASDAVVEVQSGEWARKREAKKTKEMAKEREWEMRMDKELTEEEKEKEKRELLKWARALCSITQLQVEMRNALNEIARLEKKMCDWCAMGADGKPSDAIVGQYTNTLVTVLRKRNSFFQLERTQRGQWNLWPHLEAQVSKLLPRRHLVGKVSFEKWTDLEQTAMIFSNLWPPGANYKKRSGYEGSLWYWISENEARKEGWHSECWDMSWHAFPAFDDFEGDGDDMRGYEFQALLRTLLGVLEIVQSEMPNL